MQKILGYMNNRKRDERERGNEWMFLEELVWGTVWKILEISDYGFSGGRGV